MSPHLLANCKYNPHMLSEADKQKLLGPINYNWRVAGWCVAISFGRAAVAPCLAHGRSLRIASPCHVKSLIRRNTQSSTSTSSIILCQPFQVDCHFYAAGQLPRASDDAGACQGCWHLTRVTVSS